MTAEFFADSEPFFFFYSSCSIIHCSISLLREPGIYQIEAGNQIFTNKYVNRTFFIWLTKRTNKRELVSKQGGMKTCMLCIYTIHEVDKQDVKRSVLL